ncbi:hypothetical protein OK016_11650 [Vibrio chagasii]|nr:hypothetical protein [Vibrio chagasii]
MRGGREPSLRGRGLLDVLTAIDSLHLLEAREVGLICAMLTCFYVA